MTTPPRAFTPAEREFLSFLLRGDWPQAEQARAQLASASHSGWWFDGSQSFDIAVDSDLPLVQLPDGILAATDRMVYDDGDCIGGVMLRLTGGRISSLEYYWMTDEPPSQLPTPEMTRPA